MAADSKTSLIKKYSLLVPVIFSLAIFYFSIIRSATITGPGDITIVVPISGTIMHLGSYFILSFAWFFYFKIKKIEKTLLTAALVAGIYGLFIESIQYLIPYRVFQIQDAITNFIGAFLIYPIIYMLPKKLRGYLKSKK